MEELRQLHIRIPAELHRAIRIKAASHDKTVQEVIVTILMDYFREEKAREPECETEAPDES